MAIKAFEFVILNQIKTFWQDVVAKVGTADNYIPDVFSDLPATGNFQANQQAIGELVTRLATGDPVNDLTFLLQYPVQAAHIPCVWIEVGGDTEEEVIGSMVDEQLDVDADQWIREEGGVFTKTFRVGVASFNPDTTLYLYSLLKYGLLLLRKNLEPANIAITGSAMQADYQRFGPDGVFFRYFDIRAEGILDTVSERVDRVTAVTVNVVGG